MLEEPPIKLSKIMAQRAIAELASDTNNIVVIRHGKKRQQQRRITRRQIDLCVQKGTVTDEPFMNNHGHWQVEMYRHAAGEELTCVVAIEWATRLLVITTYSRG